MLNVKPGHLQSSQRPFVPPNVLASRLPLISTIESFAPLTPTGFVIPDFIRSEPVNSTAEATTSKYSAVSSNRYMYSTIPGVRDFYERINRLNGSIARDAAGFDWFIKIFKYCVYPQIVNADLLYRPGTTQHKLLTNINIMLTDKYAPDLKSLLFQARNTPSDFVPNPKSVVLMITHDKFAEWMYHAMLINVGFPTMVTLTKVMFGETQIPGASKIAR